jgi:hypothetical protein
MGKIKGSIKTGGRKRGTPNKKTLFLHQLLEEKELDPIQGIISALRDLDSVVVYAPEDQINLAKSKANIYLELMQYLYPKRKAIEIDSDDESEKVQIVDIVWGDDETQAETQTSNTPPEKN